MLINLELTDLAPRSSGGKLSSFVQIYELRSGGKRINLGRTEVQYNTDTPHPFVQPFEVDWFFEETQRFVAEAYDMKDDENQNDLAKQTFLGRHIFTLHDLVSAQMVTANLKDPNDGEPKLTITCEEKSVGKGMTLKF